jgi:hypothetical protein
VQLHRRLIISTVMVVISVVWSRAGRRHLAAINDGALAGLGCRIYSWYGHDGNITLAPKGPPESTVPTRACPVRHSSDLLPPDCTLSLPHEVTTLSRQCWVRLTVNCRSGSGLGSGWDYTHRRTPAAAYVLTGDSSYSRWPEHSRWLSSCGPLLTS